MRWGAAGQGGGAMVQGGGDAVQGGEADTCNSVDKSSIKEEGKENKKAEVEKEAIAELLTQPSNAELYSVQVKDKLDSAKAAFENAD